MTKKDYIIIAGALRAGFDNCRFQDQELTDDQKTEIVLSMMHPLERSNPRFNDVKFRTACGM